MRRAHSRYFDFKANSGKLQLGQRDADTVSQANGHSVINDGSFYVVVLRSNGSAWDMLLNTTAQTLSVTSGSNNGDWLGDTAGRDSFVVGCLKRTTEAAFLEGSVAEVLLYDRALTDGEYTALYQGYLAPRYASPALVYMNTNTGNDANSGTSTAPVKTLPAAVSRIRNRGGGTVRIWRTRRISSVRVWIGQIACR